MVAKGSTDIVNGSQLYALQELPKKLAPKIKQADDEATKAQTKVKAVTEAITQSAKRLDKGIKLFADAGDVTSHKIENVLKFTGDGNLITETTAGGIRVKLGNKLNVTNLTVNNGPSVSELGFNANNTPITNLASGLGNAYSNAEDNHAASVGDVNAIVDANYKDPRPELDKLNKRLKAGTATGLAAAGLPQAYVPGHSMLAVAAGTYRDQHAIAVGVSRISEGGRMIIRGNLATNTASESTVSVGVGLLW